MDGIQFIILMTDYLIYLLLVVVLISILFIRRNEHLSNPWRQVISRPINVVAVVVLLSFTVIGILDSIHFRYTNVTEQTGINQVQSVFDVLAGDMPKFVESTYSAPFAVTSFAKENIEQSDGTIVRDYPRLKYAGSHLDDPKDRDLDILQRVIGCVIQVLILWAAFCVVYTFLASRKHELSYDKFIAKLLLGKLSFPWRTFLVTIGLIFLLVMLVAAISPYYHIFGTSKIGEDVLYQSLKSIRTGMVIGTITTLVMLPFALLLGTMAGYFGGWIDDLIQYIYTTLSSIPGVLLIAAAVLTLQVVISRNEHLFQTKANI